MISLKAKIPYYFIRFLIHLPNYFNCICLKYYKINCCSFLQECIFKIKKYLCNNYSDIYVKIYKNIYKFLRFNAQNPTIKRSIRFCSISKVP